MLTTLSLMLRIVRCLFRLLSADIAEAKDDAIEFIACPQTATYMIPIQIRLSGRDFGATMVNTSPVVFVPATVMVTLPFIGALSVKVSVAPELVEDE